MELDYARVGAALLLVAILLAAGWFFISGQQHEVRVLVKDAAGNPVDAIVFASAADGTASTQKAAGGSASFKLPRKKAVFRAASAGNGFGYAEAGEFQDAVEIRLGKSMLIVSSSNRLKKKYGGEAEKIFAEMNGLAETVKAKEGIEAKVFLADDSTPLSDDALRAEIVSLVKKEKPYYLLIVGGHSVVPMHLAGTPMKEAGEAFAEVAQRDGQVLTDNPYGAFSDNLKPEIVVGRLPDGTDEQGGSLLLLLEKARAAHENKPAQTEGFRFLSQDTQIGYPTYYFETNSSKLVTPATFALLSADGSSVRQDSVNTLASEFSKPFETAIITLHGNGPNEGQAMSGREKEGADDVIALLPEATANLSVAGKLVLADSCYGASPLRPDSESIPVKLLEKGARAFVGSTMTAFSSKRADYAAGGEDAIRKAGVTNSLIFYAYKYSSEGFTAGEALALAKSQLDYSKPANRLTSLEFVLYGDPTAR